MARSVLRNLYVGYVKKYYQQNAFSERAPLSYSRWILWHIVKLFLFIIIPIAIIVVIFMFWQH